MVKDYIKNAINNVFGKWMKKNDIMWEMSRRWYTYVWDSFSDCWPISMDYKTMFEVQRMNVTAQQSKNLIVKMVGKKWTNFYEGKKLVDSKKRSNIFQEMFNDPVVGSYRAFKDKYYTNHFCSGMVFWYVARNMLWEPRIQILDSRWITQEFDSLGNVKKIKYNNKEIDKSRVIRQITHYDPNRNWYGMSPYEGIVYDAMSDREASKRNFYFFKNNAMPSVILTLDDEIENPEEIEKAIKQFENKYKGTEKSHGVMASWGIKEVKTIDISNKDLELLDLEKFAIKKTGIVFWFDPRFVGYKDDANGSHAEYQLMASQSDKSMISFADILEDFMYMAAKIAYEKFPFSKVELINDQFVDVQLKQELILKKLEKGACTLKQAISELWYTTEWLPEYMDTYVINSQRNSIENLFKKMKVDIKKTEKEIEKESSENTVSTDEE